MMNERLPNGQFGKGNRFSVGRAHPQAARVFELRNALLTAVDVGTIQHIITRLIELVDSDEPEVSLKASELLLNRVLGKPTESVALDILQAASPPVSMELDTADLEALERMRTRLSGCQ